MESLLTEVLSVCACAVMVIRQTINNRISLFIVLFVLRSTFAAAKLRRIVYDMQLIFLTFV